MNTSPSKDNILCPSSLCKEGAGILGVVKEDNHIAFLKKKFSVNEEFIQIAKLGRSPEKRFRFFDKCVKGGCKQWKENRCSLIDNIISNCNVKLLEIKQDENFKDCIIRENCRWFNQKGYEACKICPEVITDLS